VPSLAGAANFSGAIAPSDDEAIYIDWSLTEGVLHLRASYCIFA